MRKYHEQILEEIKRSAENGTKRSWGKDYLGSKNLHYQLSNPLKRQIIQNWLQAHKELPLEKLLQLLDRMYKGESYEEKCMAGMFLGYLPKLRKQLDIKTLDSWLACLSGWAEIDSTCQSNFTQEELLDDWSIWKEFLISLSNDQNINKRRASLVLLTGPVAHGDDKRLAALSFEIIERLKGEKDILISKAVSWLLRSLTRYHKEEVSRYIGKNIDSLPKIAIRETTRKILTGKK